HTVARFDARRPEAGGDASHLLVELPIAEHPAHTALVAEDDRRTLIREAQQVLRKIQPRLRKETRARHALRVLERRPGPLGSDVGETGELGPECGRLLDGPGMEVLVRAKGSADPRSDTLHEPGEIRLGNAPGGGSPQDIAHPCCLTFPSRPGKRRRSGRDFTAGALV